MTNEQVAMAAKFIVSDRRQSIGVLLDAVDLTRSVVEYLSKVGYERRYIHDAFDYYLQEMEANFIGPTFEYHRLPPSRSWLPIPEKGPQEAPRPRVPADVVRERTKDWRPSHMLKGKADG